MRIARESDPHVTVVCHNSHTVHMRTWNHGLWCTAQLTACLSRDSRHVSIRLLVWWTPVRRVLVWCTPELRRVLVWCAAPWAPVWVWAFHPVWVCFLVPMWVWVWVRVWMWAWVWGWTQVWVWTNTLRLRLRLQVRFQRGLPTGVVWRFVTIALLPDACG